MTLYGNKWLGLAVVAYWFIRILCLRRLRLVFISAGLLLMFGLFFMSFNHHQRQLRLEPRENATLRLQVQPDQIDLVGNQLRLTGKLPNHAKVTAIYFLNDPQEINRFTSVSTTVNLMIVGDISEPLQSTNINEFDRRRYDEQSGILNTIKINEVQRITPVKAARFSAIILNGCHVARYRAVQASNQLPGSLKTYYQGLVLGARNQNFYEQLSGVKQLGLIHLFSISGLHVTLFMAIVERSLTVLKRSKRLIEWLLLGLLPLYFIFTGGATGLLRAILMAEHRLLANRLGFKVESIDNFGLTLLICTLIQPALLMQFGNQLSFGLAFCLLFLNDVSFIKQTLLMNLVSLPFILFHVFEWHVLSLLSNLLVLPLFSVVIFPLTFIGGVMGLKFQLIAQFVNVLIGWFNDCLNGIATLPGMITFGKPPLEGLVIVFVLTLILIGQRGRTGWIKLTILASYVVMFMGIHLPMNGEVTYFDIGQGDCFLVREPFNRSVSMIDTGGRLNFKTPGFRKVTARSRAETITINYLKSKGIAHLDGLYLSHKDADHTGDTPVVLRNLRVDHVYVPKGMQQNPDFLKRVKGLISTNRIMPLQAGNQPAYSPFKVVHPFKPGLGENGDSMVLYCEMGNLSWLFTGDLDRDGEREIIRQYPGLKVDVLKLGHHGSKTSSDPEVLKQLSPKVGIISAGRKNRYGHPNEETLATLAKLRIPYFNTQVDGMITYTFRNHQTGSWKTFLKENR